jgi:DNA repair protein RecN (Recombination protein N)
VGSERSKRERTGDRGAAKSILIDAIGLVLGDRADNTVVRHGAAKAEITLTVLINHTSEAKHWLLEHDLYESDACILRRIISAKGASRSWINGTPCNLSIMRQLGQYVVDIHGQHEHQSLMKIQMQCNLLDHYGNHHTLCTQTRTAYQSWKNINDQIATYTLQSSLHQERINLLTFQLYELKQLQLTENEPQILDEELSRLSNAGQLKQTANDAVENLYENDQSIYSLLASIINELDYHSQSDPKLKAPKELLINAHIQIQEAADLLRHYLDFIELDPKRLQWVENRVSEIHTIAHKYQIQADQLPQKYQSLNDELSLLNSDEYDIDTLQQRQAAAEVQYKQQAAQLSKRRYSAAQQLAAKVSKAMQTLGMKGGRFDIRLIKRDKFSQYGQEQVEFLVSTNPGQPLKSLVKVASGGELSRISLAIQMIAAQQASLPALIFDEVDSGIGGGTAGIVGKQLRHLSENRQVLCVTHLPQVASCAHHHYKVDKLKYRNHTATAMFELNATQRVEEIARMMGNIEITPMTLKLAQEMLNFKSH